MGESHIHVFPEVDYKAYRKIGKCGDGKVYRIKQELTTERLCVFDFDITDVHINIKKLTSRKIFREKNIQINTERLYHKSSAVSMAAELNYTGNA